MTDSLPASLEHVVDVEVLRGRDAPANAIPDLLVEVPHGADERRHYDALRARLRGELPDELHAFFHLNTDVGAWAYGRATAQALVEANPARSAVVLRSLIPRTFIDCNRPADFTGGDLGKGGMTAGIPSYVKDGDDKALLVQLHQSYVRAAEAAFAVVCGNGGVALLPHTYGPRSLGIEAVDDNIVKSLYWACAPERHDTWPLRADIDLLTRDGDGKDLSPPGMEEGLLAAFTGAGYAPKANDTYYLHASSLGHAWSAAWPGRVTSLEVRRDLLVDVWTPFEEMKALPERAEKIAGVLAAALEGALRTRVEPLAVSV